MERGVEGQRSRVAPEVLRVDSYISRDRQDERVVRARTLRIWSEVVASQGLEGLARNLFGVSLEEKGELANEIEERTRDLLRERGHFFDRDGDFIDEQSESVEGEGGDQAVPDSSGSREVDASCP